MQEWFSIHTNSSVHCAAHEDITVDFEGSLGSSQGQHVTDDQPFQSLRKRSFLVDISTQSSSQSPFYSAVTDGWITKDACLLGRGNFWNGTVQGMWNLWGQITHHCFGDENGLPIDQCLSSLTVWHINKREKLILSPLCQDAVRVWEWAITSHHFSYRNTYPGDIRHNCGQAQQVDISASWVVSVIQ